MKNLKVSLLGKIASLIIFVAPLMVGTTSCALLWGEPECPDCLK